MAGDYGKPRPALVVQSDHFEATESVTVMLISSSEVHSDYGRINVEPSATNGLRRPSQVMIDKAMTIPRQKVGRVIGRLDAETMVRVNRSISLFFGLA